MKLKNNIILVCITIIITIVSLFIDSSFIKMLLSNEYITGGFWTQGGLVSGIVITSIVIGMCLMIITYFMVQIVKEKRKNY